MQNTHRIKWLSSSISLIGIALTGCSMSLPDSSRILISLPSEVIRTQNPFTHLSLIGSSDPLLPTDFTCFGINVTGPGLSPDPTLDACHQSNMPAPGVVGGLASLSDGTISVDVLRGASRTIQLFAVQSNAGCPSLSTLTAGKFGNSTIGLPYELGRTTLDISADSSVTIHAKWDPTQPQQVFCPSQVGIPQQLSLSGSTAINTGVCTPYTLQILDASNNAITYQKNLAISLSGAGQGGFYTDNECSTSVTSSLELPASSKAISIYFKTSSAKTDTLVVSSLGIKSAKLAITSTVLPPTFGSPTSLTFTTQPATTGKAGTAFTTQPSVAITDANGRIVTTNSSQIFLSYSTSANCTDVTTSARSTIYSIKASSGIASFTGVKFNHPGTLYLKAQAPGLTPACSNSINLPSSGPFKISVTPNPIPAGQATSVFSNIYDSEDKPTNPLNTTQVDLSSSNQSPPYFYAPSPSTQATSISVPTFQTYAYFYIKDNQVELFNYTVSDDTNALLPATGTIPIIVNSAENAVFSVTGQTELIPNTCSGAFSLQFKDYSGSTSVGAVHTFTTYFGSNFDPIYSQQLAADSTTGINYYSDANCSNLMSQTTMAAGTQTSNFYVKAQNPGFYSTFITSDSGHPMTPGILPFVVQSPSSTGTQLLINPQPKKSGTCQGMNLYLLNNSFLPSPFSTAITVNLNYSYNNSYLYSDPNCNNQTSSVAIPTPFSVAQFWYLPGSGPSTMTATPNSGSILPAILTFTQ